MGHGQYSFIVLALDHQQHAVPQLLQISTHNFFIWLPDHSQVHRARQPVLYIFQQVGQWSCPPYNPLPCVVLRLSQQLWSLEILYIM